MMLERVASAPINLYFDITPIGRILNHFGTDLQVVEGGLYQHIQEFAFMILNTLQVLLMVVAVVPHMLVVLAIMVYKCYNFYFYM
jgi:ATP-binding cassette subfamily C (CFTR/MRP) protein 1